MKKKISVTEREFATKPQKNFLDMIAPSVIKFFTDYFICGNTFRCVWALREYPTSTSEQAILRYLGEKDGVTLRIYTRPVTAAEEKRIISNAANKNRMQRNSTNDLQQTVAAESNLQDVAQLAADMHRNREPLLHVAVFLEMISDTLDNLRILQTEVQTELVRSKLNVDRLMLRQQHGFMSVMPSGRNMFRDQIVSLLAQNPVLKKMYEEWCKLEQLKYETYTSAVQKFPPLEENNVFKPIKNAVIRAVLDMNFLEQNIVSDNEIPLPEDIEDNEPHEDISCGNFYMNWRGDYKTAKEHLKNKQYEKALNLFQKEADKGNVIAIYSIAKMYQRDLLGKENIPKAQEYFAQTLKGFLVLEPTADKMQPYIWYHLGRLYNFGYGTERNFSEALKWFQKAAMSDNGYAQYSLGSLYYYGNGTVQNYEKAFEWFKKSADNGNIYACYEAAKMLRDGIGTVKNQKQADVYFKKTYDGFQKVAAENPDDKIIYRLGVMTLNGLGCDADRELGIDFIKQSAELGNEYAKQFLENVNRYNLTATQNAVLSMLSSFGRLISDDYNRSLHGQRLRTEHKLKAAIRRKKQALGLKENTLENPVFKE